MFLGFCFVLFVILKSLSLRIVRADQHCPQPGIYLHLPANVNQESKSQTEEALNGVIGGRSYFQLFVRGPGLLAGQGIVLSHKPTVCLGSQSLCGGCEFLGLHLWGGVVGGWGILEGQTPWLWVPAVSKAAHRLWGLEQIIFLLRPNLFLCTWGLPPPWLLVRIDEESHLPETLSVAKWGNIIAAVDLDISLEKVSQVCLIYFFNVSRFTFFSLWDKSFNWLLFSVLSASPWSGSMLC